MAVYKLSPQAEVRLTEIYEYSLGNFGERQADRYYLALHETFGRLAEMPHIGRPFHEFRRYEHDQYVIFYELIDDGVKITMIFHHSENIASKFR